MTRVHTYGEESRFDRREAYIERQIAAIRDRQRLDLERIESDLVKRMLGVDDSSRSYDFSRRMLPPGSGVFDA